MLRKRNLPLGWASKGFMRFEDTGFYPDDAVSDIAGKFGIEGKMEAGDGVWELKQRLETADTGLDSEI